MKEKQRIQEYQRAVEKKNKDAQREQKRIELEELQKQ